MSEVTTQDMFNTMVRHLIKQRVRSMLPDGCCCAYRGADGTKCVVGALIADEYYHTDLETHPVSAPCVREALQFSIKRETTDDEERLLKAMLDIHDCSEASLEDKINKMHDLAAIYGLNMPDYSDIYPEQA